MRTQDIWLLVACSLVTITVSMGGPLRIHPQNPRYFTDATKNPDGSLKAVYLTGSHTWANSIDRGPADPPPVFDFDGYLDLLQEHRHNFIRLWSRQVSWYHDYGKGELHASPLAWSRTGPGDALDGKPKFDLTRLDQAYFDRLRARVSAARDRGIYMGIMLFGGSYECRGGWRGNPFNVQNNINGVNGDPSGDGEGTESHTLEVPAITRLHEAYVRKVIDAVNDLDNVLYEISNEGEDSSRDWQYHLIRFIHEYEAGKPKQHPVGMTAIGSGDAESNKVLSASPAEWISPHTFAWGGVDNIPVADGAKVSLLDSDHWFVKEIYNDPAPGRNWVWKAFCRGHHPILMEHLAPLSFVDHDYPLTNNDPGYIASRRAMGQTRRLADRMNLAAMTPSTNLASSGYCLASPEREYLIYLPEGGAVTVDLSAVTSELNVEWLDVENDRTVTADPVAGGGKCEIEAPFPGAAVLHLSNTIVSGIDGSSVTIDGRKTLHVHAAGTEVVVLPGQSIQAAVDANPPGTIFRIKAGVHRLQQVKPKDGDQFIGERGAILCGAKVLPAADFVRSGDSWYVGGQTQRLSQPFGTDIMIPGYECDLNPEELFVNGDTRLKRVGDLSELGPGRWYFDYGAARIHLHDDPASFSLIETSAASAAFGGSAVRDVLLENLIIEKYGNPPNHGGVGSLGTTDSRFTYDWTCRYLTVRYNHGDGIDTGPGMTVEHCKLHNNGQFGVGGSGVDERQYWSSPASAYKGRVTFRNNEVYQNGVLGYQRGWGAGGSKFAVQAAGTLVENCWFHDNFGPGIWFDVENRDTVIRSNLVENNGITLTGKIGGLGRGIFYEISFGPAKVYWNISRNNQEVAILNSNSEDVEIYENAVSPNGIMVSHDNRGYQTNCKIHHNDVGRGDLPAGNGLAVGIGSVGGLDDILPRVAIDSNTYRGFDVEAKYWWAGTFWSSGARTFGEWQSFGFDRNAVLPGADAPVLPVGAVPFALSQYGQR